MVRTFGSAAGGKVTTFEFVETSKRLVETAAVWAMGPMRIAQIPDFLIWKKVPTVPSFVTVANSELMVWRKLLN
jgi:hypothetical protein